MPETKTLTPEELEEQMEALLEVIEEYFLFCEYIMLNKTLKFKLRKRAQKINEKCQNLGKKYAAN